MTGRPVTEAERILQHTTAEQLFGRKTGQHTHPDTHPAWMKFTDGECAVCPTFPRKGRQS